MYCAILAENKTAYVCINLSVWEFWGNEHESPMIEFLHYDNDENMTKVVRIRLQSFNQIKRLKLFEENSDGIVWEVDLS